MCGRVKQLSWDEVRGVVEHLEHGGALAPDPSWQASLFDRADARPKSLLAVVSDEGAHFARGACRGAFP